MIKIDLLQKWGQEFYKIVCKFQYNEWFVYEGTEEMFKYFSTPFVKYNIIKFLIKHV